MLARAREREGENEDNRVREECKGARKMKERAARVLLEEKKKRRGNFRRFFIESTHLPDHLPLTAPPTSMTLVMRLPFKFEQMFAWSFAHVSSLNRLVFAFLISLDDISFHFVIVID